MSRRALGFRSWPIIAGGLWAALWAGLGVPSEGHADGGRLRLANVPVGPYRMSAFTEPDPVLRGPFDVSVSIYDEESRQPVDGVTILVTATPIDSIAAPAIRHPATRDQADRPELYYSAKFDLTHTGRWTIALALRGDGWDTEETFEVSASEPGLLDQPWAVLILGLLPLVLVGVWLRLNPSETTAPPRSASDPSEA